MFWRATGKVRAKIHSRATEVKSSEQASQSEGNRKRCQSEQIGMTYVHAEVKSSERPSQSEGNRQYEMYMRVLRGQKQVAPYSPHAPGGVGGRLPDTLILFESCVCMSVKCK